MAFKKGNSGRKKGAVSKVTKDARSLFVKIMDGQMPEIESALSEIRRKSAFNYIVCLSKLMPYFMPKQVDIKSDGQSLIPPTIQVLPFNADADV